MPNLFDPVDRHDLFSPLARANDPETSHKAAVEIKAGGTLKKDLDFALKAVREYPGNTAAELEHELGVRDGKVRKRLSGLADGLVPLISRGPCRKCRITGRTCQTWIPIEDVEKHNGN